MRNGGIHPAWLRDSGMSGRLLFQRKVHSIVFDSIPGMEKEAYKLSVTPQQIKITASTPNGFYYGLQTLYQLLPVAIYSKERARNAEWSVPCVEIEDTPAFRYRGAMLDVCRHFASIDYIKKFIDVLAVIKSVRC